jgi:hypothetical protein
VADHTYRIHAHNVSYPRSIETNEFCSSVKNPITGEMIEVEPTILLNDPGTVHSLKSFRNLKGDGSYVVPYKQFRRDDNKMVLDSIRTAPPEWPTTHMESSAIWVPNAMFEDKSVTNLLYQTTGIYIFEYPAWMEMGDRRSPECMNCRMNFMTVLSVSTQNCCVLAGKNSIAPPPLNTKQYG